MKHAKSQSRATSFFLGVLCLLVAGCAVPSYEFGTPPPTSALSTLTPTVSTDTDVLKVIGTPQGRGVIEHVPNVRPRTLWFYYYVTTIDTKVEGKYLFVFLDEDRFEGYLWFTSNLDLGRK